MSREDHFDWFAEIILTQSGCHLEDALIALAEDELDHIPRSSRHSLRQLSMGNLT